jgi:hypothetical protein
LRETKERSLNRAEDKMEAIIVPFCPQECTLPRERIATYFEAREDARRQLSIPDPNWNWSVIRAEEETIHIVCERDADINWVPERVYPILLQSRYPFRPASLDPNLGLWSKLAQPVWMMARARSAAAPAKLTGDGSGIEKRTLEPRTRMAPGEIGQVIPGERVRNIQIRRNGPAKRI